MKITLKYTLILLTAVMMFYSCNKKQPARVYMPDMYYPVAYDPYQEAVLAYSDAQNTVPLFANNSNRTAIAPVEGTIAQNKDSILPMEWKKEYDEAEYLASKQILTSPLKPQNRAKDLERGKKLFTQTCKACHGEMGDGQGDIVKSGAYSGVPNYKDRQISVGSVYYVIMHGRNAMGSYAGQLQMADRWRVAEYVMELKNK